MNNTISFIYKNLQKLELELGINTTPFFESYKFMLHELANKCPELQDFAINHWPGDARIFMKDYIEYRLNNTKLVKLPFMIIGIDCWKLVFEYLDSNEIGSFLSTSISLLKFINNNKVRYNYKINKKYERFDNLFPSISIKDYNELSKFKYTPIADINDTELTIDMLISDFKTLILNNYNKNIYNLPHKLEYLYLGFGFGILFERPIQIIKLPSSLVYLEFGNCFNQPINNIVFPKSLKYLIFGVDFNQDISVLANTSITHLVLDSSFNQPIEKIKLPATLIYLKFGFYFNRPVDNLKLPSSLEFLIFGSHFNEPIYNLKLPSSLKVLNFGCYFNQSVQYFKLPISLTHLMFGLKFNQPLHNFYFSPLLSHLEFYGDFNQSIVHCDFPDTLKYLSFGFDFDKSIINLPKKLEYLQLGFNYKQSFNNVILPNTLHTLKLFNYDDYPENLPSSLKKIIFGRHFNKPIKYLSPLLEHLEFDTKFNQPINNLPETLKYLKFGDNFNQSIHYLPKTLTYLKFGDDFNHPIIVDELLSLEHLEFGHDFNHPIHNLSNTLKYLKFGKNFKYLEMIYSQVPKDIVETSYMLWDGWHGE